MTYTTNKSTMYANPLPEQIKTHKEVRENKTHEEVRGKKTRKEVNRNKTQEEARGKKIEGRVRGTPSQFLRADSGFSESH